MDQIIFIFGIIFFLVLTIVLFILTFYAFNDDKSLGEKIGFTIGAIVSLLMITILLIFYIKSCRGEIERLKLVENRLDIILKPYKETFKNDLDRILEEENEAREKNREQIKRLSESSPQIEISRLKGLKEEIQNERKKEINKKIKELEENTIFGGKLSALEVQEIINDTIDNNNIAGEFLEKE